MRDRSDELDETSPINDPITEKIIGCAIAIHRVLGPGFLENIYHRALVHEFDKVQIPWYLSLAAISQAENSEPGYGQGWEGYGKRFASAFADVAIENFMTSAVFPS